MRAAGVNVVDLTTDETADAAFIVRNSSQVGVRAGLTIGGPAVHTTLWSDLPLLAGDRICDFEELWTEKVSGRTEKVSGRILTVFLGVPARLAGDVESQSAGDTDSPAQRARGHAPDQAQKFFLTPFIRHLLFSKGTALHQSLSGHWCARNASGRASMMSVAIMEIWPTCLATMSPARP